MHSRKALVNKGHAFHIRLLHLHLHIRFQTVDTHSTMQSERSVSDSMNVGESPALSLSLSLTPLSVSLFLSLSLPLSPTAWEISAVHAFRRLSEAVACGIVAHSVAASLQRTDLNDNPDRCDSCDCCTSSVYTLHGKLNRVCKACGKGRRKISNIFNRLLSQSAAIVTKYTRVIDSKSTVFFNCYLQINKTNISHRKISFN